MSDINSQQSDRRDYFRLNETLLMGYTKADEQLAQDEQENANMIMLEEFSSMTQQFKVSLGRINSRLPEVTACFKLLDAKLNLLAESFYGQQSDNKLIRKKASISGSGMSFGVMEQLNPDEIINLELVLAPDLTIVRVKAKVIKCRQQIELSDNSGASSNQLDDYLVSVQFEQMNELTQDIIVRHIMQSQSNALRKEKV